MDETLPVDVTPFVVLTRASCKNDVLTYKTEPRPSTVLRKLAAVICPGFWKATMELSVLICAFVSVDKLLRPKK
jgi:hypothetical protein